ncbi:MAG TPA: hypothetical protein VKQ32_29360 [Polyangia bacterium]|nr:hypothetical protein [Polyangia bacterium]
MKSFTPKSPSLLAVALAVAALVVALGLGSCSRSATDSLTGPATHGGAVAFAKGQGKGGAPPPPAPPPVADPCVSIAGFGGAVIGTGSVPQNRIGRLRMEIAGDLAAGTLAKIGGCSTGLAPSVTFISGTASASSGGGLSVSSTFGAFAPGVGEAGVLLSTDAAGNVLEIIWPALAVPPVVGPPILRYQLAQAGEAGRTVSVNMSFTARTANGATATFTASAANLLIPALK